MHKAKKALRNILFCIISVTLLFVQYSCTNSSEQGPQTISVEQMSEDLSTDYRDMNPVPVGDVEWTSGFWAERVKQVEENTLPTIWEYFQTDASHHWKNFLLAADLAEGEWAGTPWHDGDFYKDLEAMVRLHDQNQDEALKTRIDSIITVVGQAQAPDGYISTYIQLNEVSRFQNLHNHELYNMGHLMTAGAVHHELTGETSLLNIARKTGDFLYDKFAVDRDPRLDVFGFNPSNIMGAVDLYRATGDKRYLVLATEFINMRGKNRETEFPITWQEAKEANMHIRTPKTDQIQNRKSLREETQAVGHAVTGTYLYAGAADAYMEVGDSTLLAAVERIWEDVTTTKMAVTGAVGPKAHGASIRNDPVHEAFAGPYDIPSRGYNETCANIGFGMWSWRLLQITGQGQYADKMEKVFYNAGLSGISIDGGNFCYVNPLSRGGDAPLMRNETEERWHFRKKGKGSCCPPQMARHLLKMQGYAYGRSEDGLWVNLYGSNRLSTTFSGGGSVQVEQTTDYPWEGDIQLALTLEQPKEFDLNLRIPDWADGATARVNGEAVTLTTGQDGYATLSRQWQDGDNVQLTLPLEPRLLAAHPLVEALKGQVAVAWGPIIYAVESVDLPEGVSPLDLVLPADVEFREEYKPDLLNGVMTLQGQAKVIEDQPTKYRDGPLYREVKLGSARRTIPVQFIPYYAWNNRGPTDMSVWLNAEWE